MSKRKGSPIVDKANKRVMTAERKEGQDTEEEDAAGSEDLLNEQVNVSTVLQNSIMYIVYPAAASCMWR